MIRTGSAMLLALMMGHYAGVPAQASTVNFANIDASAGDVILTSYQGYNWTNISVYTSTPGFPGFNNGIVSPPNAAYTAGDQLGSPIISTISSAAPYDFISGYFGSGWYNGLSVTVAGLYNGTQDFSRTFTVNTTGPQLFTFDFDGINELEIHSSITASTTDPYGCGPSGCSQVTLDDLTLTPGIAPHSTPEPQSVVLIGVGVFIFAIFRRLKFSRTY